MGGGIKLILDKTHAGKSYKGIKIVHPDSFDFSEIENIPVLITLQSHEANIEVEKFLKSKGVRKVFPFYMSTEEINEICTSSVPLSERCCLCPYADGCKKFINKNMSVSYAADYIEQVNFMLTTWCSLNCKACAALVPLMKKEKTVVQISFSDMKNYVEKFINAKYYIHQVMLSGGEPTLNKDLPLIVEYLEGIRSVGYVKILTNGVGVFSKEFISVCRNSKKTVVFVDDYAIKLSKEQRALIQKNLDILEKNQVPYMVGDASEGMWFDFGDFSFRGKAQGEINNRNCYSRHCFVVLPNGWFTICGRNVAAMLLDYMRWVMSIQIESKIFGKIPRNIGE